jgi:DNA-directed RNA polymerase subunit RPC12/RpoP
MKKPKFFETRTIDEGQCCWCGKRFNASSEINYDISDGGKNINCPHCKKPLFVYPSVEYQVQPTDKDGEILYEYSI